MSLSHKTRIQILRIIPFGVIWLVAGLVYGLLERSLLGDAGYYPVTGNPYDFSVNLPVAVFGSFLFGLIIGMIEVLYLHKLFRHVSFGKKFFIKSMIYIVFMILVLLSLSIVGNMKLQNITFFSHELWERIWIFFCSISFWGVELYITIFIIFSLFFNEVSGNMGTAVLTNFLTGRYHRPTEENRIFLFADMKSSTTIAEQLGHVRYFDMLRDYYDVLSEPILRNGGEIYQYVGDEIVITWKKNNKNIDEFLTCFFDMKSALNLQKNKFLSKYGVAPTFKAGVHDGVVTTGEVGVIKQDIIFTGDVLNTAARIQGLCNSLNTDLLISNTLAQQVSHLNQYTLQSMGNHELRGKQDSAELFAVELRR